MLSTIRLTTLIATLLVCFSCSDDEIDTLPPTMENQSFIVPEDAAAGSNVGTVDVTNPGNEELTFELVTQVPHIDFTIESATGEIRVNTGTQLDYESASQYILIVKATDSKMRAAIATITIDITNINESHTVVFRPGAQEGKDAVIWNLNPDHASPDHLQLAGIAWTNGGELSIIRSYFEFDLSSIPEGATIVGAKLSLYHKSDAPNEGHSQLSGSNECEIRGVIEHWDEKTITWNNAPADTEINKVTLPASTSFDQDYIDLNVTALLKDSFENPSSNFGFVIRMKTEEYYRSLTFASSDLPDPNKHPKLEVTYTK